MGFDQVTGLLPGTAYVVASDALTSIRDQAQILKSVYGDLIQICDGIADEVEINAAITAAGAGLVHLTKGTYKTNATINLNQDGCILEGEGWWWVGMAEYGGTVILPQVAMTNSILVSNYETQVRDLVIHGNELVAQARITGTSNTLNHVLSLGHTTYNLLCDSGGGLCVDRCQFYMGPVRISRGDITFQGCYFNSASLEIAAGSSIHILNNCFETYTGYAIAKVDAIVNYFSIEVRGNYFESINVVANVINFAGASLNGGVFIGNFLSDSPNTTNFLNIGADGNNIVIEGNTPYGNYPIVIGSDVESLIARTGHYGPGISYNTLLGLTYLSIVQDRRKELYGTAAPGAGTWAVGDKVWNTAPIAGGAPGWVCTTAGTPGTWSAMANLAP